MTAEPAGSPRHGVASTAIGPLSLVATGEAITGIYFPGHWTNPDQSRWGPVVEVAQDEVLAEAVAQLAQYLSGERRVFTFGYYAVGDETSRRIWSMLEAIPYGETTTYGALGRRLGNDNLAQRVGQAVGHNPISIAIPCHRVLGADGSLTGYAGGLDRKRFLLELEEPPEVSAGRLF